MCVTLILRASSQISAAKGRYVITREEANEYDRRTGAARLQAAALQAVVDASHYDPRFNFGYPLGHPWA